MSGFIVRSSGTWDRKRKERGVIQGPPQIDSSLETYDFSKRFVSEGPHRERIAPHSVKKLEMTTATAPAGVDVGCCDGGFSKLRRGEEEFIDEVAGARFEGIAGGISEKPGLWRFLPVSRCSSRRCGGDGNDVAGRDRNPRHEGGKDSSRYSASGSGSLTRFRRGEIRPAFGAWADSAFFLMAGSRG